MICPSCSTRAEPGDRFCQMCGTPFSPRQSRALLGSVLGLAAVAMLVVGYVAVFHRAQPTGGLLVTSSGRTDIRGELTVPRIGTFEVREASGQPLPGIDLSVFSGTAEWFAVARDPRLRHAPVMVHGRRGVTAWLYRHHLTGIGPPALAAPTPPARAGGRIPVRLSPLVQDAASLIGAPVDTLADYLQDPPKLLTDTGSYRITCQTEDQMVAGYRLVRSLVLIPLKLAGGALEAALTKGKDTLGYVGITDEKILRHVIQAPEFRPVRELTREFLRFSPGFLAKKC